MTKRYFVLLALLVLLGLGVLWWKRGDPRPTGERESRMTATASRAPGATGPAGTPSKLPRTQRERRDQPRPTHAPAELKDFIIPSLEFRQATLAEALDILLDQYSEICTETGEIPQRFSYRIKGEPRARFDLRLEQVAFLRALSILAGRSGSVLSRDGTALVFSEYSAEESPGLPVTTSHRVPPDFQSQLHGMLSPGAGEDPFASDDPFRPSPAHQADSNLQEMLRQLGIIHSPEATVAYASATSTLVIRGSAADQARLEEFLDGQLMPPAVFQSVTKLVDSPNPIDLPNGPLTDRELQGLLRDLGSREGVSLSSLSVVSRPGQDATVEMIREVFVPDPDAPEGTKRDWVGKRINVGAGGYGFDVRGELTFESRDPVDGNPDVIGASRIRTLQLLSEGNTIVVESPAEAGSARYALVTIQKLDPTGRPIPLRSDSE